MPHVYLDARQPEWINAELFGSVRYQYGQVWVSDQAIESAFSEIVQRAKEAQS